MRAAGGMCLMKYVARSQQQGVARVADVALRAPIRQVVAIDGHRFAARKRADQLVGQPAPTCQAAIMPKKLLSGPAGFGAAPEVAALHNWQTAALSLAVVGGAVLDGDGALIAVLVLATVVWALARLHRYAPSAPSTSDLLDSTLGVLAAGTAAVVQLVAYALLGVTAATTLGLLCCPVSPTSSRRCRGGGGQPGRWPPW